jgi:hypothetical protein
MSTDLVSLDIYSKLPERYRVRAQEIKRRVETINSLLVPCLPETVKSAVKRLGGQFLPQPDTDGKSIVLEYLMACNDLPEWAVSEATNDYLGGRVDTHSGRYMPTCAEFAKRARHILVPFMSERASLRDEASKLIERAEDDRRRHHIDMERQDPAVRQRVADLAVSVKVSAPKRRGMPHIGLAPEKQKRLDALKLQRQFTSKIGHSAERKQQEG